LMLAAAAVAVSSAPASAEPGDGHLVRYTLRTAAPADFKLNYVIASPPSKQAYNADPYTYLKSEVVVIGPEQPWVFEVTLDDPEWAILTASTGVHAMQASPNPVCEIEVDGEVRVHQEGPYTAHCQLGAW